MKLNIFKRVFNKPAGTIIFNSKEDMCYLTNKFVLIGFKKELETTFLETIGCSGYAILNFKMEKDNTKIDIQPVECKLDSYFPKDKGSKAVYTGIMLDFPKKFVCLFDTNEGLIGLDSLYIDMAIQLIEKGETYDIRYYNKVIYFYSDKIDIMILPVRIGNDNNKYLKYDFII